jgi:hypothetical protein
MKPNSVDDAARHALWVALFFQAVCAERFAILIFSLEIEKSCLKKRFRWAVFACGPMTRQRRWQVREKTRLCIESASSPGNTCASSYHINSD